MKNRALSDVKKFRKIQKRPQIHNITVQKIQKLVRKMEQNLSKNVTELNNGEWVRKFLIEHGKEPKPVSPILFFDEEEKEKYVRHE